MTTKFYIPKKLKIGYNEREQQYVPRLAFINYYRPQGDLRFKKTFDDWIDKNVPTEEYDNIPTEGFVIDNGAERNEYKQFADTPDYIQVYDPRGFEFQISTQNLMFLLNFCEIKTGKLLTGKFVYAWIGEKGNNVQLLPVIALEYQDSLDYMQIMETGKKATMSSLEVGKIYYRKNGERFVFLGHFPEWYTEVTKGIKERKKTKTLSPYFAVMSDEELVFRIATENKSFVNNLIEGDMASESFMDKCSVALEYDDNYSQFPRDWHTERYKKLKGVVFTEY